MGVSLVETSKMILSVGSKPDAKQSLVPLLPNLMPNGRRLADDFGESFSDGCCQRIEFIFAQRF